MMKPRAIRTTLHARSSEDKSDVSINVRRRELPMLARARNLLINAVLMQLRTEIDNPVLMKVWPQDQDTQKCAKMRKMRCNSSTFNPDNPSGREMMARQVARQFCRLGEDHSWSMDAEQAAKMAAN